MSVDIISEEDLIYTVQQLQALNDRNSDVRRRGEQHLLDLTSKGELLGCMLQVLSSGAALGSLILTET